MDFFTSKPCVDVIPTGPTTNSDHNVPSKTGTSTRRKSSRRSVCTNDAQPCIEIDFFNTSNTMCHRDSQSNLAEFRLLVLANNQCNRLRPYRGSTRGHSPLAYKYYKLRCGGDGITGVFNCDSTCENCQVEQLNGALDGQCVTKPYGPGSSDTDLTFTGTCGKGMCMRVCVYHFFLLTGQ